jgi:hypothetical protein
MRSYWHWPPASGIVTVVCWPAPMAFPSSRLLLVSQLDLSDSDRTGQEARPGRRGRAARLLLLQPQDMPHGAIFSPLGGSSDTQRAKTQLK